MVVALFDLGRLGDGVDPWEYLTVLPHLLGQITVVNRQGGEWILLGNPGVFPLDTFGSLVCYNSTSSVTVALAWCWSSAG